MMSTERKKRRSERADGDSSQERKIRMTETGNRKLIEVAIPLEAINAASAREKSIRHGHPSTLHLWWARRPLAACRAVLFRAACRRSLQPPRRVPDRGGRG